MAKEDRALLEEIAVEMSRSRVSDTRGNRVSEMTDEELINYITE